MGWRRQQLEAQDHVEPRRLGRGLLTLFAIGSGVSAANLYYAQPTLPQLERGLHCSPASPLVPGLLLVAAAGLAASAAALTIGALAAATVLVGLTSVVAQVLVPFAASLATSEERSRVVGTVMGGLLTGVLVVRTLSGALAQVGTWRLPYAVGAVSVSLLALTTRARLPVTTPAPNPGYGRTVRAVGSLVWSDPLVRRRCVLGALDYAMFNLFWSTIALQLHKPPYRFSASQVGLLGLFGAAGAVSAGAAGHLRGKVPDATITVCCAGLAGASFVIMMSRPDGLVAVIVGMVALDVAVQALRITNSAVLYERSAAPPSRIAAALVSCYFVGGAIGSAAGAQLYTMAGWTAVCGAGMAVDAVTASLGSFGARRSRQTSKPRA